MEGTMGMSDQVTTTRGVFQGQSHCASNIATAFDEFDWIVLVY